MGGAGEGGMGDVWEEASDAGGCNAELDRDTKCRQDKLYGDGFREGIDQGKDAWAQEGFDEGFRRGMDAGMKWGMARGAVITLKAVCNSTGSESSNDKINLLTKQVDVQENEAAASIYNDLVTKYDDKVLVELQATGSTPSSPQEDVKPGRLPSNTRINAMEIAENVLSEVAGLGYDINKL